MTFKVGDTVRLKSHGPVMAVQQVGDFSFSTGIEDGARCAWFDGDKAEDKVFATASLKLVDMDAED